jgi:hypothetical protein
LPLPRATIVTDVVSDIDLVSAIDLGGEYLSRFDVAIIRRAGQLPQLRGTGGILGEGMVMIACELIDLVKA